MQLPLLNSWDETTARAAFLRCCGSARWAERMAALRPFASEEQLFQHAQDVWQKLTRSDWLEAFAAHPRIGDVNALRVKFATAEWAKGEQAGAAGASEEVLHGLAEGNRQYEANFGYLFIVCATGKTAAEMLALLRRRLENDPEQELLVAGGEQARITRLRLEKL